MQQIGPVLADPLLQIGDTAGQFGPLVLQGSDNMRFRHNSYPHENKRIWSSSRGRLTSWCWWRLLHKTAKASASP